MRVFWLLSFAILLVGCRQNNPTVFPNLFELQSGEIKAIYIEDSEEETKLILDGQTIAKGNDWVVNWADFPSAVEYAEGKLAVHYLVMKDPKVFAYDIEIILSDDGGHTWAKPFTPHTDSTLTEHGFVSMVGVDGKLLAVWLDGRRYADGEDKMELRGALISSEGRLEAEYLIDENVFAFCWIVDYPMFEKNESTNKIEFSHNPFSMPQGDIKKIDFKKPLNIKAYQYDIVCNGVELSSGAIRNHIPDLMYKLFSIAGYDKNQVDEKFGGMINALSYGAPPHGGIAPGIDRIVMLLANEKNIREVTMFPMNQNAQDLMMNAPSKVSEEQLKELNLNLKKKK